MHFQDVITALQRYWGERSCVLLQPYDMSMGAGTFHPATTLRSLGPQPWRCGYAQPSRRPSDARYGENPNRLGHYYQYQVILKPSPLEVQELYLGSLEAIGIDLRKNDIRFVEDDWESPTLGAWGLGWEVWMNGLEISQFTYFQQVGGVTCRPVPAELTYGLERLTMALQGVQSIYDISWVDGVSYREVYHRNEVEQSKYNFEYSNREALFELFNRHFEECQRIAEAGLALPAYDHCIATSHAFNLLDARGAISVAERQQYIRRIRELACLCARTWVDNGPAEDERTKPVAVTAPITEASPSGELLVEVQCEELPASFVRPAVKALRDGVVELLSGIEHGEVRTWATARRIAVVVDHVAAESERIEKLVTGPPAERAFSDGQPTKMAMGFARGRGVDVSALEIVDGPKGKVVAARVVEGGRRAAAAVAEGLDALIRGLQFSKTMEWGTGGVRWARPIHRVNAILGGVCLGGVAAGRVVGNETAGHRLAAEPVFRFTDEASWLAGLRSRWVEPDLKARRAAVEAGVRHALRDVGGDDRCDPALLEEVTHLVEWPVFITGTFEPALLELPSRLLVESMKKNQRYFPVYRDGALTESFIIVSNNPSDAADSAHIARGNAAVLAARFDDARFFLAEDKKKRLEEHGAELTKMRWIRGLGSMAEKANRIGALAAEVAEADADAARRAGQLCKSDLVTLMVGEFPSLQGHMGTLYASHDGESDAVAAAIEEHYLPAHAGDEVARSAAGVGVALADRLDTLVGCFGIGLIPKGGDPQGLRRAASGVLSTLLAHERREDIRALLRVALANFHTHAVAAESGFERWVKSRAGGAAAADADNVVHQLTDFLLARFRAAEIADGATADLVDAVLAATPPDVVALHHKVSALKGMAGHDDFKRVMQTFKRVLNITAGDAFEAPPLQALHEPSEVALAEATASVESSVSEAVSRLDYGAAVEQMLTLQAPVAALFDAVLVDDPDPAKRAARIGLLQRVGRIFLQIADFTRISTR